jgi:hypothetical protein
MDYEDTEIVALKRRVAELELELKKIKPVVYDVKSALMGETDNTTGHITKIYDRVGTLEREVASLKHVSYDVKGAVIDLSHNTRDHVMTLYQYLGNLFEQTRPLLDQLEKSDQGAMGPIIREIKAGVINFLEERERRKGSGVKPPPESHN